jgi:sugar phosphate isomerase/epimerase
MRSLGIRWVEIGAPAPGQVDAVAGHLQQYGMRAASVCFYGPHGEPDFLESLSQAVDSAARLGAPVMFTSQHAGKTPRPELYARLRSAGDICAGRGVTLCLETHPDLCMNSERALETMQGINHPNVRINFDAANIHYYNEGAIALAELRPIVDYVRSVHLKDSAGGFHEHNFPAIGDGAVDWKGIISLLNARGMTGPFTLEMEGIAGEDLTFEQTEQRIRRSIEFLRGIGAIV